MTRHALGVALLVAFSIALAAQPPTRVPRIWDDTALADWATPIAALNLRPAHYSSAEYYSVPGDNLRTYPVYAPEDEPPGYWDELQKKKPEPLVDVSSIRSQQEWIAAGERAFSELDSFWTRTSDPSLIAAARNPRNFDGVLKSSDGAVGDARWVVTEQGVLLSRRECGSCHRLSTGADGMPGVAAGPPPGGRLGGGLRLAPAGLGEPAVLARAIPRVFSGDSVPTAMWRMFTVPWAPDERVESLRMLKAEDLAPQETQRLTQLGAAPDVFPRPHGSPYYAAKVPDLRLLRYSRYIDATATHRLRGPEDVARYAALIVGADRMDFGSYRILTDNQRRVRFRYPDEVLYAIGMYLMSLEPPKNPSRAADETLARGQQVFRREGCVNCHVPPDYTSGKLTLAEGWQPPATHPNHDDIAAVSVGTDPGLALRTRKGTGFYKIPSLRGVWYRPRLLHDASMTSLEEMFDAARLSPDYEPKGWNPPRVTRRAVPGHRFGLTLGGEDRNALLAFVRSL
jgi:cytochrome c551/c552